MTAEERMAYFQGEKRRRAVYQESKNERNNDMIFLKIKFFVAVILFIAFLSLFESLLSNFPFFIAFANL